MFTGRQRAGVCHVGRKRVSRLGVGGGERSTAGSNTLPGSESCGDIPTQDVKHMEIKAGCVFRPGPAQGSAAPPRLIATAASTHFLF